MLALLAMLLAASDPGAPPPKLETIPTGYLDTRGTYAHVVTNVPLPSDNAPSVSDLTEANLQLKLRYGELLQVFADTSLLWQAGAVYYGLDGSGGRIPLPEHDNPGLRPAALVSELYATATGAEHFTLTLGKKRVVWGASLAQNPTDLLNPPKDPTDPTFQRAGAWLARAEFPFERWTFSLVGAGKVLRQYGGLPTSLVYYPGYPTDESARGLVADDRDLQPHFALAARAYALVADTDVNVMYFFTNAYNDAFLHKSRAGLSLSHVFGGWELHVEALAQRGSSQLYFDEGCVDTATHLVGCVLTKQQPAQRSKLDETQFRPRAVAGGRYTFEDNSLLSLEYYFNGQGYTPSEFQTYAEALASVRELSVRSPLAAAAAAAAVGGSTSADPSSPQKFAFDPLRRHYLFATYTKSQIHDDFTAGATLLVGLEDLSGQLVPTGSWSARDWLTFTVTGYVPIPGISSKGADVRGIRYTEFDMLPTDWRFLASVRAFY